MNDDRMDDLIRAAATEFNSPPPTPREDMWAAIVQARGTGAEEGVPPKLYVLPAAARNRPTTRNVSASSRRAGPRLAWWNMAAAAALLVATGVGIGRWTTAGSTGESAVAPASSSVRTPTIAATPEPEVQGSRDLPDSPRTVASGVPADDPSASGSFAGRPASRIARLSGARAAAIESGRAGSLQSRDRSGSDEGGPIVPGSQSAIPYQVATIRHLTDAEALLTSFTLESRDRRTDSRLAGWAKGLLSNTRLLLDSPAGDDPRRAELLQDLELVLAQIVQLSPDAAAQERDLIDGSIRHGAVMTRLRTAIPAGPTRGY